MLVIVELRSGETHAFSEVQEGNVRFDKTVLRVTRRTGNATEQHFYPLDLISHVKVVKFK